MQDPKEIGRIGPHEMVYAEREEGGRVIYFCAWCDYETTKKFMLQHFNCERDRYKDNDRYSVN